MKKQFLRLVAVAVTFTLILNLVSLNFGIISADSATKTKTWTFDSVNDLKDFESFYHSKADGYAKDDSISQSFRLSNGKLIRDETTRAYKYNGAGTFDNISALTLNDPTLRNFDFSIKYKKSLDYTYSKYVLIGMREKTPGQISNADYELGYQLDGTKTVTVVPRWENGSLCITSNARAGREYFDAPTYTIDKFNTIRIKLVEDKINVWVNDTLVAENVNIADTANKYGYLSVYYANSYGEIDEISLTKLDKNGNEIDFVPTVDLSSSAFSVPFETSINEVKAQLPTQVNVNVAGYKAPINVANWECSNYNPSVAGTYTFNANVVGYADYFSSVKVKLNVTVNAKQVAPPVNNKVKTWTFNSENDLKDFESYYYSKANGYTKDDSISESFKLSNGKLIRDESTRKYELNSEGKYDNITALTLKDPTLRNFDFTIKYKKSLDYTYSKYVLIGMREKTPGQISNGEYELGYQLDGTKTVTVVPRMENGSLCITSNARAGRETFNASTFVTDNFNTIRVKLVGNKISVWVNDSLVAEKVSVANTSNQCGYLSVYYANCYGEIDEISITRLDENGNEIDFKPNVSFAKSPISVPIGTSIADVKEKLSTQANAVYSGYEVPVECADWVCDNYNPSVEGTYTFRANIVGLAQHLSGLQVEASVKVNGDVIMHTLTNANQINSAFDSKYSNNILQFNASDVNLTDKWSVTDSGIVRKPSENANAVSDSANMAILTYKKQKLSNYVLSVKYKQGSDSTAKSPIIGFGSDTVGKFASEQGGGIAAYVTADGKLKLWSNKFNTSGDYRLSYNVPNYDSTAEHQFKIIVGSTKVSYYIDGSLITTYVLKDYTDGYVYLACGSNQGTFKNFEISPLTGINYVSEVADVNVKLNTSIEAAKDKLPKSVDTTLEDGSKKKIDILEWSSETYDSNYSGKYKFTGKLNADSTLNPALLDAYAIVEVSEVYDPDITRRYFFDSADDLDDFTAYYATEANPDIKGSGFKQVDWRNNWFLTDGMLKKANQGAKSDSANVAMLVLNKQKYKNFELTIDFKQGTESYRWAMVGFGAKKMGEFALSKDGGRVNYLQQEGVISGWSREYVTGWEYHKNYGAALENYERNAIHRMKITVLGSKVTIKVDDYPAVVTDAPENYEGGYIYLAVNGNSAMFDNLTIIDYDVKNRKITEVLPNEKIVYDHNDKFAEYTLPEIVNVKADDGRVYHMAVEWNCPEFRSNIPGIYKHVGKIIIPSNKFTNPKNLTGKIDLEVIVDYDPNTSIKYYFDSDAELDDFVTYYTKTTGNDGLKKVPTSEQWEINESGRIARINQEFEQRDWSEEFASTKISTLVWDVMQLENFEVEVDYKQGTNTWLWAMVVFGIKDPTKWIMNYTGSDSGEFTGVGGYACYAEQEGTARFWGDSGTRLRLGATLPGVVNYNRGAVNHMKINVVNGIAKIYINEATEPLAVETRTHDTKGKIALACGMNLAEFDNLKITALDSAGNPANVGMSGMVSSGTPGGNSSSGSSPQTGFFEDLTNIQKMILITVIASAFVFSVVGVYVFKFKKTKHSK